MARVRHVSALVGVLFLFGLPPAWPRPAAGGPLRVHLISSSKEKSEPLLRRFRAHLEKHYHVRCTASYAPTREDPLEGLEHLATADVMLIYARRLKIPEDQKRTLLGYWRNGGAAVGIRWAGHAFPRFFGGHYTAEFKNEPVRVEPVPGAEAHPVLRGVGPITSRRLFKAKRIDDGTRVLQTGDNGKARYPVTTVSVRNGGRRVFTSMGVPDDFENPAYRRLLVNALFWAAGRDPRAFRRRD